MRNGREATFGSCQCCRTASRARAKRTSAVRFRGGRSREMRQRNGRLVAPRFPDSKGWFVEAKPRARGRLAGFVGAYRRRALAPRGSSYLRHPAHRAGPGKQERRSSGNHPGGPAGPGTVFGALLPWTLALSAASSARSRCRRPNVCRLPNLPGSPHAHAAFGQAASSACRFGSRSRRVARSRISRFSWFGRFPAFAGKSAEARPEFRPGGCHGCSKSRTAVRGYRAAALPSATPAERRLRQGGRSCSRILAPRLQRRTGDRSASVGSRLKTDLLASRMAIAYAALSANPGSDRRLVVTTGSESRAAVSGNRRHSAGAARFPMAC